MKPRVVALATLDPTFEFESMCQQFRVALHPLYVHGVSLYDESGVLLWLTASFGPKEDEAVRKAYDKFAGGSGSAVLAYDLGGARSAMLFRITSSTGQMLGAAMVVVDSRVLQEYGQKPARLLTEEVLLAMRYFAGSRQTQKPPKPLARRPALALVVQRLVSLREDAQPVRCEVLWALPSRTRRMGKDDVNAIPARQIRMHSKMERRALIEFCRWVGQQPAGWRESMPFMWLKFSIGALLDKTFVHFVEQCLTTSGLPNDRLGFEIPAHDAAARAEDLTKVATSIKHLRCFIVIDNFTLQSDHLDLLGLPAVHMVKLAPEIATAMRTDTWLQKRVACTAQTTRALGIKIIVKRTPSRSEALWYRDFGVEFAQSQALSPGEPIGVLKDIDTDVRSAT